MSTTAPGLKLRFDVNKIKATQTSSASSLAISTRVLTTTGVNLHEAMRSIWMSRMLTKTLGAPICGDLGGDADLELLELACQ